MALPDFLVVGAPKAGSTAVHQALNRHPQLFLSSPKEPKFFLADECRPDPRTHRGPGDAHSAREWIWRRDRYERLFDPAPAGTLKGESTPFYLWDPAAHHRIHRMIPAAKLIAIVRDPIERAYSNWTHLWCDGLETEPDFLAACALEPERVAAGYAPFWRYLALGRYGEQFAHLFSVFPREQVHVLRYRDLIDSPAATLDAIATFLGVEPGLVADVPVSNVSPWAASGTTDHVLRHLIRAGAALGAHLPPQIWRHAQRPVVTALHRNARTRPTLTIEARRELVSYFDDDIRELEHLLGTSFQDWLDGPGEGRHPHVDKPAGASPLPARHP